MFILSYCQKQINKQGNKQGKYYEKQQSNKYIKSKKEMRLETASHNDSASDT